MTTIVLCGRKEDTSVSDALLPALNLYGGVMYAGTGRLSASKEENPRFLLCDYSQLPELSAEKGILFFKNSFSARTLGMVPPGFLCAFESHNQRAAKLLQTSGLRAVACGLGSKDTLTCSSIDYSSITVSLQRALETLDGSFIEPHEIPIQTGTSQSPRQILAVCTVLLLSGIDSSNGYQF